MRTPYSLRVDDATFASFYARYEHYVRAIVRTQHIVDDPIEDHEDIVQDVFSEAARYWSKLADSPHHTGWLKLVTRHHCIGRRMRSFKRLPIVHTSEYINIRSSGAREGDVGLKIEDLLTDSSTPDPAAELMQGELAEQLSEQDRQLLLAVADGWSQLELAEAAGTQPANMHMRINRARDRALGLMVA